MRAHTIITINRRRRNAGHRVLVLALGICALAIPASAYADPPPYRSPEAVIAAADSSGPPSYRSPEAVIVAAESSDSSLSGEAAAVAAGHAHRTPGELAQRTDPGGPALVSSSPTSTSDGFDWTSAAVGAGAAMALACLGGAVLLTVRRRTAVSSSAASMS